MSVESQPQNSIRGFLFRRLRRVGLVGMLCLVVFILVLSGRDPEKIGDNFQIALPLLGLGCAIADGGGVQYFGRYLLLEVFIKTPKNTLGDAPINLRPNGSDQGFPSGHTAVATFGASALAQSCLRESRTAQAVAVIAAGFTGASRISAEKHNIWQVLAGAVLGWLMTVLPLSAYDRGFRAIWDGIGRGLRRIAGLLGPGSAAVMAGALLLGDASSAKAEMSLDLYTGWQLSLIHISEPTRPMKESRIPSYA